MFTNGSGSLACIVYCTSYNQISPTSSIPSLPVSPLKKVAAPAISSVTLTVVIGLPSPFTSSFVTVKLYVTTSPTLPSAGPDFTIIIAGAAVTVIIRLASSQRSVGSHTW